MGHVSLIGSGCRAAALLHQIFFHKSHFHGVIPGTSSIPLGQVTLLVTFGSPDNFRTENVVFEVADFETAYQAIFG